MAASLSALETRVKVFLSDSTSLVFTTGLVDEALRLALAQYNLALGRTDGIADLDGSGLTTLLPQAESLLVLGAAGYAAQSRIVKRSESFNLGQKIEEGLIVWGKNKISDFNAGLNQLRLSLLRQAAAPPFPTAADATPSGWLTDDTDTTGRDV